MATTQTTSIAAHQAARRADAYEQVARLSAGDLVRVDVRGGGYWTGAVADTSVVGTTHSATIRGRRGGVRHMVSVPGRTIVFAATGHGGSLSVDGIERVG